MAAKVVFIVNCITQKRCMKRVHEFVDNGYEVEVYGFTRSGEDFFVSDRMTYEVIGCIAPTMSYARRLLYVARAVRQVFRRHRGKDVLYYVFSLDMALSSYAWLRKVRYVYEESDLMHTYVGNAVARDLLERMDRHIIGRSLLTVLTSEGFAQYHWGGTMPDNVHVITNRLDRDILQYECRQKPMPDISRLRIGFVGIVRSEAVMRLAETLLNDLPGCEVHFYGKVLQIFDSECRQLARHERCRFHGKYSNPADLPDIYAGMDVLLSAYDARSVNVRYADPNKLYESIYFETPIIVSSGTFLAAQVERLGVGRAVDVNDNSSVRGLMRWLTDGSMESVISHIKGMDKMMAVNINDAFFKKLKSRYGI